jgi:hypothetical protein
MRLNGEELLLSPRQTIVVSAVAAAVGLVTKYVACLFLTLPVLSALTGLVFSYESIFGPEMPWLRHFAFVIPFDSSGHAHLDEHDIMRIFARLAFAFMILSLLVRGLWRLSRLLLGHTSSRPTNDVDPNDERTSGLLQKPEIRRAVRRLAAIVIGLTSIYLITFAVIPNADWAEDTSVAAGYAVFAFFYVLAVVSAAIYVAIDSASNLILGWAVSRLWGSGERGIDVV